MVAARCTPGRDACSSATSAPPTLSLGDVYQLSTIVAVVLGGAALSGSRLHPAATVAGALFLSLINQDVAASGIAAGTQGVIQGAVLVPRWRRPPSGPCVACGGGLRRSAASSPLRLSPIAEPRGRASSPTWLPSAALRARARFASLSHANSKKTGTSWSLGGSARRRARMLAAVTAAGSGRRHPGRVQFVRQFVGGLEHRGTSRCTQQHQQRPTSRESSQYAPTRSPHGGRGNRHHRSKAFLTTSVPVVASRRTSSRASRKRAGPTRPRRSARPGRASPRPPARSVTVRRPSPTSTATAGTCGGRSPARRSPWRR